LAELPAALKQILATEPPRGRVMIRRGLLPHQAAVSKALNAVCVEPVVLPEERIGEVGSGLRVLRRLVSGLPWGIAVVSARARPGDWLAGRVTITVVPEGFVVRKLGRRERAARLAGVVWRGVWLAAGLAVRGAPTGAGEQEDLASGVGSESSPAMALRRPTLSVVLLSCNRWASLEKTLEQLGRDPALAGAQVIVADNGSGDGSVDRLRERYPGVELVALPENRGVAGFNEGVRRASGDAVLILDDDACPEPGVLDAALGLLAARPWVGAVALHPRHPSTKGSEWRFAERSAVREDWPVMGCGNLVRREAWERVGGYEESFFLYRNDVDLALKLLGAGYGVYFDPAWTVWHDSPGAAKKSLRWFELATRNWVWLCRRHGRGATVAAGVLLGWAWAHRLAGRDWRAHAAILRGAVRGIARRPGGAVAGGGAGLRSLLSLRLGRRARD
jgi:GT2 family glycosyltransferase